ncbi:MAG TPA: 3-dehydroquinate synthase II [Methanolinea sp.]|jgi:3-dehydroquinate synthase II|nr:3-dehydroquinate synthase II [Methanolinea sp.]HOS82394.1 3-dehydroquinate synthase II [Methanolinea sp.]HPC54932.1 3-dehydroquinate synthase II [Methanolinea sp.]HQE85341.1 3-dehydroquinate synthase II [Methanolinea sp.]HQI14291.1 3-dehydroquinate synthase II [Methanolinea sp.]
MKEFWVDARPWRKNIATAALESGAGTIVADSAAGVKALGRVRVVAPDGDLVPGRDVFEIAITGRESEELAVEKAREGYVVIDADDWKVIPLENLVARSDRIIARVTSPQEALLALQVLEKGVAGVLLDTDDPAAVKETGTLMHRGQEEVSLVPFTITAVRPAGMGDRVCVDTCSLLSEGEGLLVGNTSSAFLLVHAETLENPYVAPRPFRVNAGAVHAYLLSPGGKTSYLSDLSAGDRVLVVDRDGVAREVTVGRVKIEKRPLLLVEAEADGVPCSLILQNAETIRLVAKDGSAVSVVGLSAGDTVMGCVKEAGRHFGMAVRESIVEK